MQTLRIAVIIPALLVSTCAFAQSAGSGGAREESREVQDFDGVQVSHGLKATVKVGPKSVRVSGEEEQVGRVRTQVKDGKLVVRVEKRWWFSRVSGVQVTISSPRLTSVSASGGADVEAEVAATDAFTAEASVPLPRA